MSTGRLGFPGPYTSWTIFSGLLDMVNLFREFHTLKFTAINLPRVKRSNWSILCRPRLLVLKLSVCCVLVWRTWTSNRLHHIETWLQHCIYCLVILSKNPLFHGIVRQWLSTSVSWFLLVWNMYTSLISDSFLHTFLSYSKDTKSSVE